jgi:hypothetical protein
MEELWIKWVPIKDLAKKYLIESVTHNSKGLDIVLCEEKNNKNKLNVFFEGFIHSYKWTEELYNLKIISILNTHYPKDFYTKWTFFKVVNSSYAQSLLEGSEDSAEGREFIHYLFFENDGLLEVIAPAEPSMKFMK